MKGKCAGFSSQVRRPCSGQGPRQACCGHRVLTAHAACFWVTILLLTHCSHISSPQEAYFDFAVAAAQKYDVNVRAGAGPWKGGRGGEGWHQHAP